MAKQKIYLAEKAEVDAIKKDVGQITTDKYLDVTPSIENGYITPTGNLESGFYHVEIQNISSGDEYRITTVTGINIRLYVVVDSGGNVVGVAPYDPWNTQHTNEKFVVSDAYDGCTLYVDGATRDILVEKYEGKTIDFSNVLDESIPYKKIDGYYDIVHGLRDYLATTAFTTIAHMGGFWRKNVGSITPYETGAYTDKLPTKEGDKYIVESDAFLQAAAYIIFNGDEVIAYGGEESAKETATIYDVTVPSGATHIAFSCTHLNKGFSVKRAMASDDFYMGEAATVSKLVEKSELVDKIYTNFVPDGWTEQDIPYESDEGYYPYGLDTKKAYPKVYASEKIALDGYKQKIIKVTGQCWAEVPLIKFYRENGSLISTIPTSRPSSPSDGYKAFVDEVIEIPSDCASLRIHKMTSSGRIATHLYFTDGSLSAKVAEYAKTAAPVEYSPLYGKKLVTAGDSYTHASFSGDYAEYYGKNYGYYVAQRHGMTFTNSGLSGSIMALDKDYVANPSSVPITTRSPFSYQRYLDVPEDTDYLTIWFGINDNAHTNLGTIDDETNETFYGAWNKVLRYYLTNRPFMKIGLIVTTGASEPYRQAVRDVAKKWGYPYLDWIKDDKIPAFFDRDEMSTEARTLRRQAFGYNDFSAHPNPQWHEYASTIYEKFLLSL